MTLRLGAIVEALGGALHGNPDLAIHGLAPLESAGAHELSFLSHPKYQQQLSLSRAACLIVSPAMQVAAMARGACIVVDKPYLYFARVTQLWRKQMAAPALAHIHPSAVVDAGAFIDPAAFVGQIGRAHV